MKNLVFLTLLVKFDIKTSSSICGLISRQAARRTWISGSNFRKKHPTWKRFINSVIWYTMLRGELRMIGSDSCALVINVPKLSVSMRLTSLKSSRMSRQANNSTHKQTFSSVMVKNILTELKVNKILSRTPIRSHASSFPLKLTNLDRFITSI